MKMEELGSNLLIDPVYEKDIKLKHDLARNVLANGFKKLLQRPVLLTAETRAEFYTGIAGAIYPQPVRKLTTIPDINLIINNTRPAIQYAIQKSYSFQVLPVKKHVEELVVSSIVEKLKDKKNILTLTKEVQDNVPKLMVKFGYQWQRLPGTKKTFIVEKPEYVNARYKYFKSLKKYRDAGTKILYLGVYDLKEKFGRQLPNQNCFLIGVSPTAGLLCKSSFSRLEVSIETMLKTVVKDIILKRTSKNTVVVIEESDDFVARSSRQPTKWSSRMEMMNWLDEHGIPYSEDMHRCEFYDLIQNYKALIPRKSEWEAFLIANGWLILRRPAWMSDFSIFETFNDSTSVQNDLPYFDSSAFTKGEKLSTAFGNFLQNITLARWKRLDERLVQAEQEAMARDDQIEEMVEKVMTMVESTGLSQEDLAENELDSDDED